jgi:hypothetical protein
MKKPAALVAALTATPPITAQFQKASKSESSPRHSCRSLVIGWKL